MTKTRGEDCDGDQNGGDGGKVHFWSPQKCHNLVIVDAGIN